MVINIVTWKKVLLNVCKKVIENENYLCELDSFVGDGDHGITVAKGFRSIMGLLESTQENDLSILTSSLAKALGQQMGGAIGPIFQGFFSGLSSGCKGVDQIDIKVLDKMFSSGLENVKLIGGASEGDKTLIDSLSPACAALSYASAIGLSLEEALQLASQKSKEGCFSTTQMIAKKGRAKYLAANSLNHQDAGATTMYLVIQTISDSVNKSMEE